VKTAYALSTRRRRPLDGRWAIRRGLGLQAKPCEPTALATEQSPQDSASLRQETNAKSHLAGGFLHLFPGGERGIDLPTS